jgi:hypothetical protein
MPSSVSFGNATTGSGIPAYVHVAGNHILAAGLDLAGQTQPTGADGQGHGAVQSAALNRPNAQYSLKLSLTGKTYNGIVYPTSVEAIATLVDALNDAVTPSETYADNFTWESYGCPPANSGFYKRSNSFDTTNGGLNKSPAYPGAGTANAQVVTLTTPYGSYDADVVITGTAVGQSVVEVFYPVFDNDLGDNDGYLAPDTQPAQGIFAEIIVTVLP